MRNQRGVALLLVLWMTTLLAALLVGVAAASRSHAEAALYGAERVRAQLAAEAGLARAVAGLRAGSRAEQWVPDGRHYTFAFDGAKVTVSVVDVSGLVDLNAASPGLLRNLFVAAGADAARTDALVTALSAWRSRASQPLLAGARMPLAAGRGSLREPVRSIYQLQRLPGMDAALFERVAPAVTVESGRNFPDPSYAGPLVLAALQGSSLQQATLQVAARRKAPAGLIAGNGRSVGSVAGGPLVAGYGGIVERVFSVASMPDGTRAGIDTTLRLALTGTAARPYKVLAWRDDPASTP